jgi:hypothetical protein
MSVAIPTLRATTVIIDRHCLVGCVDIILLDISSEFSESDTRDYPNLILASEGQLDNELLGNVKGSPPQGTDFIVKLAAGRS